MLRDFASNKATNHMRTNLWKLLNILFFPWCKALVPKMKTCPHKIFLFFSTPPSHLNSTEASPKKAKHNDWGYLFEASCLISSFIVVYLTSKPILGEQESFAFFIFSNPSTNFTGRSQLVQGNKQLIKVEPQKQPILLNYSNQ